MHPAHCDLHPVPQDDPVIHAQPLAFCAIYRNAHSSVNPANAGSLSIFAKFWQYLQNPAQMMKKTA
jgi:hypothetical protein